MSQKTRQIGLAALVLMTITTVFGYANTTIAFQQMGYASIIWYIIAAFLFFLPAAFMFAEFGSSLKDSSGGIYSWIKAGLGEKWAFIGAFIYLISWDVWLISTSSRAWIPLSSTISGKDMTQTWSLFGLNSTQTIGVLAILWMIVFTLIGTRGVDKIAKLGSIGGTCVMILNGVFIVASIIILFANHFHLAQPMTGQSFIKSPNPQFQSGIAIVSFLVYAIFAYSGTESLGSVVDSVKQPERNFPKGMLIATILTTVLYALMIFMWGWSTNWDKVINHGSVNLGNITYVLMANLGVVLGDSIGVTHATALIIGSLFARLTGLAMLMAYFGSFSLIVYSPLKALIAGSAEWLWSDRMKSTNHKGMPSFAMWIQCVLVCIVIFAVAFGGSAADKFYLILTDMSNVSTAAPFLFLIAAFPFFKKRTDLNRPFVVYKKQSTANVISTIVFLVILFGIIFSCAQPIIDKDYQTAFWTIIGPILFGLIAWLY